MFVLFFGDRSWPWFYKHTNLIFFISIKLKLTDKHIYLTYGEIIPESIRLLINDISPIDINDVFYDLGSGTGKVCLQILQETNVKKSCGIEYDKKRYDDSTKLINDTGKQLYFINNNFIDIDISDATIIFTDSIMFSNETLDIIEKKAYDCPNLKYLISMKQLKPKFLKLINSRLNIKVTWGTSQYYIYSKKKNINIYYI